jgi:hypothetical protein
MFLKPFCCNNNPELWTQRRAKAVSLESQYIFITGLATLGSELLKKGLVGSSDPHVITDGDYFQLRCDVDMASGL